MATILVVDDEYDIRNIMEQFLGDLGYTVLTAEDSTEAIRISQDYSDKIDILISDLYMPGMPGHELAAHLTESRPDMRVVFASASRHHFLMHADILRPDDIFLEKPFNLSKIAQTIQDILSRNA